MANARPTLFEQIKDVDRSSEQTGLRTSPVLRWVIIALAVIGVGFFLPGRSGETHRLASDNAMLGTMWNDETVISDFTFPVTKSESRLNTEREQARRSTPWVFTIDQAQESRAGALVQAVVRDIDQNTSNASIPRAIYDGIANSSASSRRSLSQWLSSRGADLVRKIYQHGPMNMSAVAAPGGMIVVQIDPKTERLLSTTETFDTASVAQHVSAASTSLPDDVRGVAQSLLRYVCKPQYLYSEALTERAREGSAYSVPQTIEIVHQGDIIVRKGTKVDQRTIDKLRSYRDAQFLRSDSRFSFFVVLGSLGHAMVIIAILLLYLYFLRRTSYESNGQLASLLSLPVITAGMAWLSVGISTNLPLEFVVIVPAFAMLISVLYEARTAFICTLVMATTVSGVRGNDYGIGLILLVAGMFGAYTVNNIQKRTQIFTSILAVFGGFAITILSIDLERATAGAMILEKLILASVNSVISPLIAFGVILLMEKLFNVATDLRLEEFDDLNHPLLKQLNERAPGTYQHTLSVARLSEAAARAIEANALLAKVGALYHDVGKLEKSEYFVENQIDIDNKHDKLPPKKSAAIIRQHVQDGIDLAREYGLPERIVKFVPMHHGTILIKHFYAKALDESLLKDAVIDEADYRYPGPRPDCKEAAIVMLADASEALSRVLEKGQREDLEAAVEKIIVDRYSDGQLSNTDLTMHDLDRIKDSFVRNLLGSTHQRIRYKEVPEPTEPPPAS
ncbi:MAG: HDIG domain-containing protein [Bacteroidetes bacterium]|nr:HDIG domain-containing protein [Bacteroidota bacterium]